MGKKTRLACCSLPFERCSLRLTPCFLGLARCALSVALFALLASCSGDSEPDFDPGGFEPDPGKADGSAFRDLEGYPTRREIEALAGEGIATGFEDGAFRPSQPLVRAQFASLVARAFRPPASLSPRNFRDVPVAHWAYSDIERVAAAGFMSGYDGNRFEPYRPITRAEVVAALASGLGLSGGVWSWTASKYADADAVPGWARQAYANGDRAAMLDNQNLHHSLLLASTTATRGVAASYVKRARDFYLRHRPRIAIMGPGRASEAEVRAALRERSVSAGDFYEIDPHTGLPRDIVSVYWEEASAEGVAPDVALAQMLYETVWLRFGGELTPEHNNWGNIGDEGGRTARFRTFRDGVRAHIQMLKAYGSTEPLRTPLIAPRFAFVARGIGPTLDRLTGRWNARPRYGARIRQVLDNLRQPVESRIWLSCLTATPRNGAFRSYTTSSFKAGSTTLRVTSWLGRDLERETILSAESATSWVDAERTLRAELIRRGDGAFGLAIAELQRSITMGPESSRCEEDYFDADIDYCGPNAQYACDTAGCRCVDTGAAPLDPWGNAIIDTLAGSLAGPLRSLAAAGSARIAAVYGDDLLITVLNSSDQTFASQWTAVQNEVISRQYSQINDATVDALVRTTNGFDLDQLGREILVSDLGTGARSITLGEAHQFSLRTGRELGLIWDPAQRQNYVIWGAPNRIRVAVTESRRQLIWHTHPTAAPPSYADSVALAVRKQSKSFVIPADAMNHYRPQILPFRAAP